MLLNTKKYYYHQLEYLEEIIYLKIYNRNSLFLNTPHIKWSFLQEDVVDRFREEFLEDRHGDLLLVLVVSSRLQLFLPHLPKNHHHQCVLTEILRRQGLLRKDTRK